MHLTAKDRFSVLQYKGNIVLQKDLLPVSVVDGSGRSPDSEADKCMEAVREVNLVA